MDATLILSANPFQSGYFNEKDQFYGHFSKYLTQDRTLIMLDANTGKG